MGTLETVLNDKQGREKPGQAEFDIEQWKAQKQQELDDVYSMLDAVTTEVCADPDKLKAYLDMQAKLHGYGAGNTLLVLAQNANAMAVASYKDWQDKGRAVKRGETGIKVLIPVAYTREDNTEGIAFRVGRVFDMVQTHGDNDLPPPAHESDLKRLIAAIIENAPAKVEVDDAVPENVKGRFDISRNAILIRSGLDDASAFRVMARETAHAVYSMVKKEEYDREGMGMQAYCAAYLTSRRFGVEFPGFRADLAQEHIKGMAPREARDTLNDIRQAANMICGRIERNLNRERERNRQRDASDVLR